MARLTYVAGPAACLLMVLSPGICACQQQEPQDKVFRPAVLGDVMRSDDATEEMYSAVGSGDVQRLKAALHHGANVNVRVKQSPTAEQVAFKDRNPLLTTGKRGITMLMDAVGIERSTEVVRILLRHGADVNAQDIEGSTPLMYASIWDYKPDSAMILLQAGARTDIRNDKGQTALDLAKATRNAVMTKLLTQAEHSRREPQQSARKR